MKKHALLIALGVGVLLSLIPSGRALAADAAVLRIVQVELSVEPSVYAAELEKGRAILKRLGSEATLRVWQGTFAGENAGLVFVGVLWPSQAAFQSSENKIAADAEYQAWLKGLAKMRKVASDGLYKEILP